MAAVNITKIFDGSFDFKRWAKRIVVGGGGVVGAQALSAWACTKWNDNRVSHRIAGGYCSDGHLVSRGAAAAHLQRRPDLMNRVSRLLQPGADLPSDAYYCILGAPNSGKTHIVRKACEEVGGGVIYMQITVPDMFGQELATAIDYQGGALNVMNMIQNNIVKAVFGGGGGGSGVKDQIDTAIDALVKGSRSFQAHHRRPVVLVLDDVDKLAEKQPGLLEELQSCAKSWSNSGLLRVVFVLSDGPALSQMKRRSAWSRANVSGFVTVDDVGREDALAYLSGRGVSDKDAVSIYRVAGGRIGLLSHLATSVADMGIGCEEALHSVVEAAADEFKVAGLLDEGPRRAGGIAAIKALLDAGGGTDEWTGISMTDWSSLVPQPANQKALLASRVFVRHYPHQEVMFGSRPSALYAQHLLGSSGGRKHHGWRDHHPHSRSGGGHNPLLQIAERMTRPAASSTQILEATAAAQAKMVRTASPQG